MMLSTSLHHAVSLLNLSRYMLRKIQEKYQSLTKVAQLTNNIIQFVFVVVSLVVWF